MCTFFKGFEARRVDVGSTLIHMCRKGTGAPVLMLHGFPQTHLMWHRIAPLMANEFTVVCADLRGNGASGAPPSTPDHAPYCKREMAHDMVRLMRLQGFDRFHLVGHDRGARVAYRMALDHPEAVRSLSVLDVLPTVETIDRADARFALSFWPWSLLSQPQPLPERLLAACPEAVVMNALSQWGSHPDTFGPDVRARYVEALRSPEHVHAICEEYRAATSLDAAHDREDLASGRRVTAPTLVLWSRGGALDTWYADAGGPLTIWKRYAVLVTGRAMDGGHFFPEEQPQQTLGELQSFLRDLPD